MTVPQGEEAEAKTHQEESKEAEAGDNPEPARRQGGEGAKASEPASQAEVDTKAAVRSKSSIPATIAETQMPSDEVSPPVTQNVILEEEDDPREELNAWIRSEALKQINAAWQAQRRLMRAFIIKSEREIALKRKDRAAAKS